MAKSPKTDETDNTPLSDNGTDSNKTPVKTPWFKMDEAKHKEAYPHNLKFILLNKLVRMISINLTKGFEDFQTFTGPNGLKKVRTDVHPGLKSHPMRQIFLRSKERYELNVCHEEVVYKSAHLEELLKSGFVTLRQDVNGELVDITYDVFMQKKQQIEEAHK